MPRSTAARSTSARTTCRPALAHAVAMPLPMVPAPMIATLAIGVVGVSFGTSGHARDRPLGEERVHERLALVRAQALEEDLALAADAVGKRQRGRGLDRVHDLQRREHVAARLPRELASRRQERRVRRRRAQLLETLACLRAAACSGRRRFARKRDGAGAQVAADQPIDEAGRQRVGGADRLARHAHLDRLLDADQTRQALRALGARNDAQVHLGLAHLRVRRAPRGSGRPSPAPGRRRAACREAPSRPAGRSLRCAPADRGCPADPSLRPTRPVRAP